MIQTSGATQGGHGHLVSGKSEKATASFRANLKRRQHDGGNIILLASSVRAFVRIKGGGLWQNVLGPAVNPANRSFEGKHNGQNAYFKNVFQTNQKRPRVFYVFQILRHGGRGN